MLSNSWVGFSCRCESWLDACSGQASRRVQEPVLFARSVRRNILYGLEAEDGVPPGEVPSSEDVEEAARLANAHDFVMAMPQGYDTVRLRRDLIMGVGYCAPSLRSAPVCALFSASTSVWPAQPGVTARAKHSRH